MTVLDRPTATPASDTFTWELGRIEVPDEISVLLGELAQLEHDWDGYGALPIRDALIEVAWRTINDLATEGVPVPELFPVPTGGVQLEWHLDDLELEVEFDPSGRTVILWDDRERNVSIEGEWPEAGAVLAEAFARLRQRVASA